MAIGNYLYVLLVVPYVPLILATSYNTTVFGIIITEQLYLGIASLAFYFLLQVREHTPYEIPTDFMDNLPYPHTQQFIFFP